MSPPLRIPRVERYLRCRLNHIEPLRFRAYARSDLDRIPQLAALPADEIVAMKAVSAVLPFRVNNYVIENLIDWNRVPEDPIFQLTFPRRAMLDPEDFVRVVNLVRGGADQAQLRAVVRAIQDSLNPHPSGQIDQNVPVDRDGPLAGIQHKYRETVLFFPAQGQTCHAYCTYCFRWPQFIGVEELRFADREGGRLGAYLEAHPDVVNVLFTGGDPLVMKTQVLRRHVEPLLAPQLEHVASIRIGTKATAFWPYRFVTDHDADDLLRLFEEVVKAGRHLAIMAHYSHPRELETPVAREAIRRIRSTGAVIRCQAPLIRHVNDDPDCWAELWRRQERAGCVPYYMFVERDTGAKRYFEVPLARALEIYTGACRQVSGLARTARGPTMSATPGKVCVDAVLDVEGERVFGLRFLQARDPAWVNRPFFARFDPEASWLTDLVPAGGATRFFFEAWPQPMRGIPLGSEVLT